MSDFVTAAAGVVALVAAVLGVFNTLRQSKTDERMARLKTDLDAEIHMRTALIDRELRAEDVLSKYRAPLAAAAFDLQSRLYNILELDFLELWGGTHARADDAIRTTMFRLAQYFGWSEILRRSIQFLSFPEIEETRRVTRLQQEVAQRFLTHKDGTALMIWSDEQRAIGEQMIVESQGEIRCMGYAAFHEACDDTFAPWCERLRAELGSEPAQRRMREAQNILCELVEALDPGGLRYAHDRLVRA